MAEQPRILTIDDFKTAPEPGRGTLILVLGVLSLVLLGPFGGIPAWVMGRKDLKRIDRGFIDQSERNKTKSGMILGIIGTFFSVVNFIFLGILVVVFINMLGAAAGP